MAIMKEWRCLAHGELPDAEIGQCPYGCPDAFVKQEIRTPPSYHDGRTRGRDNALRMIADDHGLTDMRNDPKANLSVLDMQLRQLPEEERPHWESVKHAAPGFSQTGEAAPVYKPPPGFAAAPVPRLPQPRTQFVGRAKE